MSMQIAALASGLAVPASQEKSDLGQKAPLPGEHTKQAATEQIEFSIPEPGDGKSKAPDLQQTAANLEKISLAFDRRLKFVIDQESRQILIKVIDNETDKVIKVLPPQELQRLHSRIRETMGFLFDAMV